MMSYTDFQPYILPETDDWALPAKKAMELLEYLESKGMKQVICVPPVRQENPNNTTENLKKIFQNFQAGYKGNIKLKLAARYRLDSLFEEKLTHEKLLTISNEKELLVDVHPLRNNSKTWEMLDTALAAGYTPVIMQPERTIYWGTEEFVKLKEKGCRLMMNLYSFFGYNGDEALNYSRMLIRRNLYTYIFSGMEDTKIMRYSECFNLHDNEEIENLFKKTENENHFYYQPLIL